MVTGRSRACGSVRLSVATPPKSSAFVPTVISAWPTLPLIGTDTCGLTGSSVVTTTVPVTGPPNGPDGENTTVNDRWAPTGKVTGTAGIPSTDRPGVLPAPIATLVIVSGAVPTLFTVRSAVPVFWTTTLRDTAEPRGTVPKFSDPLTVTWGSPTLAAALIVFVAVS